MSFYEKGSPDERTEETNKKESGVLSFIVTLLIAVGVALCINFFVIVNAVIPSGSMEETIMTGDRVFGFRWSYAFSDPERYDIVIFKYPDNEKKLFIKRVIGLPGETVVVRDGEAYIIKDDVSGIDDETLYEDPIGAGGAFLTDDSFCPEDPISFGDGVFRVPEGHYFMLGDNRNHSSDARFWTNTFVEKNKILGKAVLKYWPLNEMKTLGYNGDKA